jgi:hypothetical protein
MRLIETAIMPDGTRIQLEDWSEDNSPLTFNSNLCIAVYPISKHTTKHKWIREGEPFRLSIVGNKYLGYLDNDVRADYEALKEGRKRLEDLAEWFWEGTRAMWLLGMDVEYKGW